MLDYEKQIFLDILQDDGLVVAAKGLGLDSVIVNLLKVYCDPGNLVFVLGTEEKYQAWIVERLIISGVTPSPRVVSSELKSSEREQAYLEGGLWFVPTRILIVDLLKKRIPIDLITGFIVCKAHNILKNHQESFIIRLYRQGNKTGFIKAFSNEAASCKGGFSKIEQILKALFLKNLFLWPRYHALVKSTLNQCKPTVVELQLEMTSKMLQLQNSLLDLIKISIQELKRLNPMLDTEEVTVENAITKSFQKLLHYQMDPVWHALSERTKTLLADLKLLHFMTIALLNWDSVSFYSYVCSQRKSDRAFKSSGWHLLPSADILFTVARQRVFGSSNVNVIDEEDMDAEPNPKWMALSQVLNEIHKTVTSKMKEEVISSKEKITGEPKPTVTHNNNIHNCSENMESEGDILILVRDERTCTQLRQYLISGSKELLKSQYRKCFCTRTTNDKSEERMKLKQEEGENNTEYENSDPDTDFCKVSLSKEVLSQLDHNSQTNLAGFFEESFTQIQKSGDSKESAEKLSQTTGSNMAPIIAIRSFLKNLMYIPKTLEEMKPEWVIMYDCDMTLVRQLEVYQRNNPAKSVTVYFLLYGGTIEEQAYLTALRKEKEAFDYLIQEKARIVIPEDRSDCPELTRDMSKASDTQTRKGGLEPLKKTPSKIIVDMREFRSELPTLIHGRGIDVEPVTISIGDYVLTPDICVERKSVSDLIQSLNSGRLYKQAMSMIRHYTRPMLLIEFDKDKPFDLQDRYYLGTNTTSNRLFTKLQLLTLHLPKLKIIWSPSPYATAELFEELKQGHPEPDPIIAAALGQDEVAKEDDIFNPAVQSFLSKLPGVTSKNINFLLHKGKSLDNLKKLSKNDISVMIENPENAEIIYDAFHKFYVPEDHGTKSKLTSVAFRGKRKRFH